MLLLNFSHPLTDPQREQIEALAGQPIAREIHLPAQFDTQQPFGPQLDELLTRAGLTTDEWQTEAILINLPSLNFISALLLADLHGRMGYFPPCLRLRPVKDVIPPRFEVAEILDLQGRRDAARATR